MKNQVSTKEQLGFEIEALPVDTCMLVSARKVNGGKIQLEFAEKISELNENSNNVLLDLNADDDRFNSRIGARRAWITASPDMFEKHFGVSINDLTEIDVETSRGSMKIYPLAIVQPKIGGLDVHIQVNETVAPKSAWDLQNRDRAGKTDGNGNYLYYNGSLIYSNTTIVKGKASHTIIKHDAMHNDFNGLPESVEIKTTSEVKSSSQNVNSVF